MSAVSKHDAAETSKESCCCKMRPTLRSAISMGGHVGMTERHVVPFNWEQNPEVMTPYRHTDTQADCCQCAVHHGTDSLVLSLGAVHRRMQVNTVSSNAIKLREQCTHTQIKWC